MAVIFLYASAAKGEHRDEWTYGKKQWEPTMGLYSAWGAESWLWEDSRQEVIRLATDTTNFSLW